MAESLGKNGVGIVPVAGEPVLPSGLYGDDRIFLVWESADEPPVDLPSGLSGARIEVEDPLDLGTEIFRAELAAAAAGEVLESIPLISLMWRRPSVWRRRRWAGEARSPGQIWRRLSQPRPKCLSAGWWKSWDPVTTWGFRPICLPGARIEEKIDEIRRRITGASGAATTFGYGPRFLHSTGQVHKGGPPSGVFLQIVDDPRSEVQVPGAEYDFARLIAAQAEETSWPLGGAGRKALRVTLGSDRSGGLEAIVKSLD